MPVPWRGTHIVLSQGKSRRRDSNNGDNMIATSHRSTSLLPPCLCSGGSRTTVIRPALLSLRSSNSNNIHRQWFKLIHQHKSQKVTYPKRTQHVLRIIIDLKTMLQTRWINSRDFRSILILSLTFLLLKFERDTPNGSFLNSTLVNKTPIWGYRLIKWVVNPAILLRRRFDGMTATSSQIFLLVWKSRVRRG
jgi:hypothetical protein